tara:strand:- start:1 stop:372 length:372 start_codon:yes stop_codon:yes gene_type:complete
MADRKEVNKDFAYYIEGDRLAILYKNQSTGKYESWTGSNVSDGIRIKYTAKYEAAQYYDNNFADDNGVDSGLHIAILEYVKHRLEEDSGRMDKSAYFLQKYRQKISTYSHSKKGARGILLPPM